LPGEEDIDEEKKNELVSWTPGHLYANTWNRSVQQAGPA